MLDADGDDLAIVTLSNALNPPDLPMTMNVTALGMQLSHKPAFPMWMVS